MAYKSSEEPAASSVLVITLTFLASVQAVKLETLEFVVGLCNDGNF